MYRLQASVKITIHKQKLAYSMVSFCTLCLIVFVLEDFSEVKALSIIQAFNGIFLENNYFFRENET